MPDYSSHIVMLLLFCIGNFVKSRILLDFGLSMSCCEYENFRTFVIRSYQLLPTLWKDCMILQVICILFDCILWLIMILFLLWLTMSRDPVAVQKRGYVDLQEMVREDSITCSYGSTLPQDSTCTLPCSLTETDPSTFLIRGENYLEDRLKV